MFMLILGAGVLLRMHKHSCVFVCLLVCVCCLILPSRRQWSPPEHSTSSEHTASWHTHTDTHTQIHSSLSQPCFWPSHIWGYMHPRHPTAETKKGEERMRTEEKNKEMGRRGREKKESPPLKQQMWHWEKVLIMLCHLSQNEKCAKCLKGKREEEGVHLFIALHQSFPNILWMFPFDLCCRDLLTLAVCVHFYNSCSGDTNLFSHSYHQDSTSFWTQS